MTENDFNTNPQRQPSYQYGQSGNTFPQPEPQPGQTFYQNPGGAQQMPGNQPYGGAVPPTGPQGYYTPTPNQKWNTLCIIGFILSFIMPIIGLVLSVIALVQINRSGEKSKGMSIAGIIISAFRMVLDIIVTIVLISSFGYAADHADTDDQDCDGSHCSSNPYGDDDDDDTEDEDTGFAYYLYDFGQGNGGTNMTTLSNVA